MTKSYLAKRERTAKVIDAIVEAIQSSGVGTTLDEDRARADRIFFILFKAIRARRRWVRTPQSEFEKIFPNWRNEFPHRTRYLHRTTANNEIPYQVYYDKENDRYYFSRNLSRYAKDVVLPDWHVVAIKTIQKQDLPCSDKLIETLYTQGDTIVTSIRSSEGVWA